MKEFDARFRDIQDYFLTGAREIWEERGLAAALPSYYHPAIIHRDARGVAQGPGAVLAAGLPDMAAVPDRRLLGEEVIWTGSDRRGFLGSHRMVVVGRHSGESAWGSPTGKALRYRVMADRFAKANQISDEWQVVDTAAILSQIGQDVQGFARARLEDPGSEEPVFCPEVDVPGPYTGKGNDSTWGLAFELLLERLMAGQLSVVPEQYDRACHLNYPGGAECHGWAAAERFWLGLRQALPGAQFVVHHRIGLEEPMLPPRAALRWSLTGRHEGWGLFGRPTGAHVHIMGISHAEFGPEGLRREWTLFDAVAVWMQILASEA
ncbi:ester cyclase [Sagittula sp. S175]|uniref:nuclear transport factor 2 family protein n=1 Tax=Sagittula sp. S175 TaxID=3415129 RepID=UPI003C798583